MSAASDPTQFDCRNASYVEQLLEDFLRDPALVPPAWQSYFRGLAAENGDRLRSGRGPSFRPSSLFHPPANGAMHGALEARLRQVEGFQERVGLLVREYRVRGHLAAQLDPLGLARPGRPELAPATYSLREADMDRQVSTISIGGPEGHTLRALIERLRNTYCRHIGVQFMHIDEWAIREWLQQRMEACENRLKIARATQLRILTRLTDAVIFEQFVRKKFVGAKTFSLEGAESLIPLLDLAIEKAASQGVEEIVFGMAHRGRLNVLANIIGKRPQDIFWEFADPEPERFRGRGDVKYHMGFSGDWKSQHGGSVHLSLCFNPSHLEFVNPVALGRMRAKQERSGDAERRRGMVVLIHGDAAFAGEGVVQETLNLSQLAGYRTGGTLHVIVNNQIGFTTSPEEDRSTTYATDVARMLSIPIFHVNGEHPEAVAQAMELALDFRRQFQRDVVIDMYCYRRWGHNEADEPSFTQPLLYQAIEHRPSVRDGYLEHLLELGGVTRQDADRIAAARLQHMQEEFERVREPGYRPEPQTLTGVWQGFVGGREPEGDEPKTGVPAETLSGLLRKMTETPVDLHVHRKLQPIAERRRQMAAGGEPLDWSAAEALAMATLAVEGHRVRLSGQDSERGTFSHRHAVLHDVVDGRRYEIFQHLAEHQAPVEIINSPLSEIGVLGFEYGFSLDCPAALVMWEAQFGDFWNAAQVMIDQFITSAEDKWRRLSGLVMLLPHGFEGQGPEHSSARVERFLALAAEDNIQIVWPTTPAQFFHCLRRQVKRSWQKPLVVLTPKSLLRHKRVVSPLAELAEGRFERVLADERAGDARTRRIVLCSGKVYYDLVEAREAQKRADVAILRVEQLYPLQDEGIAAALKTYPDETPVLWVQEEPQNMGAWSYWKTRFGNRLIGRYPLDVVARPASASPATGSGGAHKREQAELLERALA